MSNPMQAWPNWSRSCSLNVQYKPARLRCVVRWAGLACVEKKTVHASERDAPKVAEARQQYRAALAACPAHCLKFIGKHPVIPS